jgi:hypothetical protein
MFSQIIDYVNVHLKLSKIVNVFLPMIKITFIFFLKKKSKKENKKKKEKPTINVKGKCMINL